MGKFLEQFQAPRLPIIDVDKIYMSQTDKSPYEVATPISDFISKILSEGLGENPGNVILNQHAIPRNLSEAYTNEIDDPCDLTQASWIKINGCVATLSGQYINGHQFTKLRGTTGTANPGASDSLTLANTATKKVAFLIIRNISVVDATRLQLIQTGATAPTKGQVGINWTTGLVTLYDGDALDYKWLDDVTIEIYLTSGVGEVGFISWEYRIQPPSTGDTNQEFLVTECQLVDETTTMFPFVDGSHTKDEIDIEFTMPDAFTKAIRFKLRFAYDAPSDNPVICEFYIDASHFLAILYAVGGDYILGAWEDGDTVRYIISQQFDDGTLYTDVNQEIVVAFSFDPAAGINGSRLIIIPMESGAIFESTSWSGVPDTKTSTFPTESIAHVGGANQGDLDIMYNRTYAGTLVGEVNSLTDLENLLRGMTPLFSAVSSPTADQESIDENTTVQNAIEKTSYTNQLLRQFDNWHSIDGINEPAFLNAWVNFGGTDSDAAFIKEPDGTVKLKGKIKTGTVGLSAFLLPNGWKPYHKKDQTFSIGSNGAFGLVKIDSVGNVIPIAPSSNVYVLLDGISFYAGF